MLLTIQALIFDMDGVITDTVDRHFQSWKQLAHEVGLEITPEHRDQFRGVSREESLHRLLNGLVISPETKQDWMRRKNMHYLAYIASLTPADILPGVVDLLDEADAKGIKKAVASSSRNVHIVLQKLELIHRFDSIVDANMIRRTKPEPDLFVWAAGSLGVTPDTALVFEDAQDGVEAALVGGFHVIGLGSARVEKAHVALPSLEGVTLDALRESLSKAEIRG